MLLPIPSRVSSLDLWRKLLRSIDTLRAPIARVGEKDAFRRSALPLLAPPRNLESALNPMETSPIPRLRERESEPDRAEVAPLVSRGTLPRSLSLLILSRKSETTLLAEADIGSPCLS